MVFLWVSEGVVHPALVTWCQVCRVQRLSLYLLYPKMGGNSMSNFFLMSSFLGYYSLTKHVWGLILDLWVPGGITYDMTKIKIMTKIFFDTKKAQNGKHAQKLSNNILHFTFGQLLCTVASCMNYTHVRVKVYFYILHLAKYCAQ